MDKDNHDYEIIFVDVGQGDATIIQKLSNLHSVLIDAGSATPVLSRLKQSAELEGIFITHWDRDHIGGVPAVIDWIQDSDQKDVEIFVNRQVQSSAISKRLAKTFDEARENRTIILSPVYKEFPQQANLIGGCFFILWPLHEIAILHPDDKNLDSLVLRFEVGKFRFLLGGDAKGDVWPHIDLDELKADVFKYPHHGGELYSRDNSWPANELITKVNPAWIVVSVGAKNPYRHPSKEFVDAQLKHPEIQFLDTIKGDISLQVESDAGTIRMIK